MQTTGFLNDHADWQQISVVNTAIAAQKVVKDGDKAQADFSNVIKKNYNWLRDAASAVNKFIR